VSDHEVFRARGVELHHCDHSTLGETVLRANGRVVDAVVVDAPYSERTHAGHDGAVAQASREGETVLRANGRVEAKVARRDIDYTAWRREDVDAFVALWSPLVTGWIVSLTDDELRGLWRAAMDRDGRQTFQDVPAIIRGMSVRLVGDGPSSWAIHIAVGRPRTLAMARWGTLDGGYSGPSEKQPVVGGKPVWLMRALVRDYTRPGDLVCDPCAGGGTTLLAAALEGRRALGAEPMREHFEIACRRIAEMPTENVRTGQRALFR
jgi:site-specific DNA-methyltransferase (adenine-specific)